MDISRPWIHRNTGLYLNRQWARLLVDAHRLQWTVEVRESAGCMRVYQSVRSPTLEQLSAFLSSLTRMVPPPHPGHGWSAAKEDVDVDTIDLTGSSPEPERRPQLAPQQQRLQTYFKKEPRADFGGSSRVKTERKAAEMNPRGSRQRARQVHPQHVAQLIDTTNPHALRGVLLDLCRLSPALSGALVRGLAPHSTFAHGLVRRHQNQPASSCRPVKKEESEGQDSYERVKQRLAAQRSVKTTSLERLHSPSTIVSARGPRYAGSQSVPRIKREPPPAMDDPDSDLDSFIPGAFSPSIQHAKSNRGPLQTMTGVGLEGNGVRHASQSSNVFRAPTLRVPKFTPLSARSVRAQESPGNQVSSNSCTLCHQTINDELETCFHHPSSVVDSNGDLACGNCKEPLDDIGCTIGWHVNESEAQLERSQMGPSESPSKRPRIL
ncbi:hypothetical protein CC86DRAFT_384072 [Ophiobolus disseminans]|uniref:Uncharacterized protein n=1 Tax=Ophiobolus disseminans TaxID=1469910 RepID=A0A6A6ZTP7_9PLEO|nr:hypothetical protein CC86DRAFT_384072 [Ophiobolus disseminans]